MKLDLVKIAEYLGVNELQIVANSLGSPDEKVPTRVLEIPADNDPNRDEKLEAISDEDRYIDLSTQYGIAQFKFIMENGFIRKLKETNSNNDF